MVAKIVPERAGLTAAQTRDAYYDYNNAMGLQTKARFDGLDGEGITTYYDGFGEAGSTVIAMAGRERWLAFLNDEAGRRIRLTQPDNAEFGFAYDALGRTTAIHEKAVLFHGDDYVIRYWYKPEGPRHAAVRGAGSSGFTTIHYYDPELRPTAIINDLPVAGADSSVGLSYNEASQITQRVQENDSYAAPTLAWFSRACQVNGLNQSMAASNRTYGYDANGNLVSDGTTN